MIRNGSFEDVLHCPVNHSEFDKNVTSWFSPNIATPDLYARCSKSRRVSAEKNTMSRALPIHRDNYAGIILYQKGVKNYREYIATKLDSDLVKGQEYYFSCYVRVSELQPFCVDSLDVQFLYEYKFQKNAYTYTKRSGSIFSIALENSDSAQWKLVGFSFIATGAEKVLIIGNFETDINVNVVSNKSFEKSIGSDPVYAYYLIDSVTLVQRENNHQGFFGPRRVNGFSFIYNHTDFHNPFLHQKTYVVCRNDM